MQNRLKNQSSPYLLQHAENPVDWYPWCDEAFEKAKREDKPIFLSIGYSTCHWCHVMAHESFEDMEVAEVLNHEFVCIKVDKEERPDIDSVYMAVCQAFTGSGGWPTSIFLTPEQKPFFAGTYFPKYQKYGQIGFLELLSIIKEKWNTERKELLTSAENILNMLNRRQIKADELSKNCQNNIDTDIIEQAVELYQDSFDIEYGGFGKAPKFPAAHNLLFLMQQYSKNKQDMALRMAEKTLLQMYRGGIFDHIGGGFSRYSTDRQFLVPHFEKMLYDNALLIMAYCRAYQITKKWIYCHIAEKTAEYVLREMTSPEGGFYSAQDADSEGKEGKYYLIKAEEMIQLLGEERGREFNQYFNITEEGNLEGENIPNLLHKEEIHKNMTREELEANIELAYAYRKKRYSLHLDDKILTSWNALMIAAMCHLYRITGNEKYLLAAKKSQNYIERYLQKEETLYVSYREGHCSGQGYLDDYANEIFALLALYEATLDKTYLKRAEVFVEKVIADFYDKEAGGFFLYGINGEPLILRLKETYDGAVFSGNSAMAYNLVRFYFITGKEKYRNYAEQQLKFLMREAKDYPMGYAMFLVAVSDYLDMPEKIIVVPKKEEDLKYVPCSTNLDSIVKVLESPTEEYPMKEDKTTYYVCKGRSCQPAQNEL